MNYAVVFGWPTYAFYDMASGNSHTPLFDIRPLGLMINLAAFLTLVTSTVVVCERWRRRSLPKWQFSLQSYFVVVTAVTVVAVLYHNEERLYEALPPTINDNLLPFNCLHHQPTFVVAPILFAGFCMVICVLSIPELFMRRSQQANPSETYAAGR